MRDFRLMFAGIVAGGFWARFFIAPLTIPTYLLVCAVVYALIELVAYLSKHLRWTR